MTPKELRKVRDACMVLDEVVSAMGSSNKPLAKLIQSQVLRVRMATGTMPAAAPESSKPSTSSEAKAEPSSPPSAPPSG